MIHEKQSSLSLESSWSFPTVSFSPFLSLSKSVQVHFHPVGVLDLSSLRCGETFWRLRTRLTFSLEISEGRKLAGFPCTGRTCAKYSAGFQGEDTAPLGESEVKDLLSFHDPKWEWLELAEGQNSQSCTGSCLVVVREATGVQKRIQDIPLVGAEWKHSLGIFLIMKNYWWHPLMSGLFARPLKLVPSWDWTLTLSWPCDWLWSVEWDYGGRGDYVPVLSLNSRGLCLLALCLQPLWYLGSG